jgi:hypothetical protein
MINEVALNKITEYFERQRRPYDQTSVRVSIKLFANSGIIMAEDLNHPYSMPMRLLDPTGRMSWHTDSNDEEIESMLRQAIDEFKAESMEMSIDEKYRNMVAIVRRKLGLA